MTVGIFKWFKRMFVAQDIEVRFYAQDAWTRGKARNGIYHGHWWATGDFPLKLMPDGSGIMLLKGHAGTGKTYPGFEWRKVV